MDAVKLLLQLGADINLQSQDFDRTPLHEALTTGMLDIGSCDYDYYIEGKSDNNDN